LARDGGMLVLIAMHHLDLAPGSKRTNARGNAPGFFAGLGKFSNSWGSSPPSERTTSKNCL
jgi:hypothetical protein